MQLLGKYMSRISQHHEGVIPYYFWVINIDMLMWLMLRWYWIMMDDWDNWTLWLSWRLKIWSQYVQVITVFSKIGDGYDIIRFVDVIIIVTWKESRENIFFVIQKGTDIGVGHIDLKVVFNDNIWIYGSLGKLNIFMYGDSPGIELCKILIWADVYSRYLQIQICIGSAKVRG